MPGRQPPNGDDKRRSRPGQVALASRASGALGDEPRKPGDPPDGCLPGKPCRHRLHRARAPRLPRQIPAGGLLRGPRGPEHRDGRRARFLRPSAEPSLGHGGGAHRVGGPRRAGGTQCRGHDRGGRPYRPACRGVETPEQRVRHVPVDLGDPRFSPGGVPLERRGGPGASRAIDPERRPVGRPHSGLFVAHSRGASSQAACLRLMDFGGRPLRGHAALLRPKNRRRRVARAGRRPRGVAEDDPGLRVRRARQRPQAPDRHAAPGIEHLLGEPRPRRRLVHDAPGGDGGGRGLGPLDGGLPAGPPRADQFLAHGRHRDGLPATRARGHRRNPLQAADRAPEEPRVAHDAHGRDEPRAGPSRGGGSPHHRIPRAHRDRAAVGGRALG